ncbi:MAG: hypothetical protein K5792_05165 [Butyrivibrio sp.]|nr:hypothetical protein [Butyrivibrio sp.]
MALNISDVVSAVNNYLYSISDVANATSDSLKTAKAGGESIFQKYLNKATEDAVASDDTQAAEVVAAVAADPKTDAAATPTVQTDDLSQKINGVFDNMDLESKILSNIESKSVDIKSEITKNIASHTVDVKAELVDNMASHNRLGEIQEDAVKEVSPSTTSTEGDASSNFNAYNGLLGSGALKELADSSYFTSNLVQSSIINADDLTSKKQDASNMTIADLNTNSLMSNTLGNSFSALDSNDYTSALINSYKNNSASNALFDFTV